MTKASSHFAGKGSLKRQFQVERSVSSSIRRVEAALLGSAKEIRLKGARHRKRKVEQS
jgi:hypothetical protein